MMQPAYASPRSNFAWYDEWEQDTDFDEAPKLSSTIKLILGYAVLLGVAWLVYGANPRAAGVMYGVTFCALAWQRFELGLALTIACVPFQQDIGGLPIKLALSEVNLALLVPVLLVRQGHLPISWKLVAPAFLYLAFCVAVTLERLDSTAIKSMIQMILYLIVAVGVFANSRRSPGEFYRALDALVVVMTIFALSGLVTRFHFLGIHKNGWGASLSLGVIVAFELWQSAKTQERRRWLFLAVGVLTLALVLTVSRGGWMAAMVGIGCLLSLRRDFETLSRLAVAVVPLALIGWVLLPEDLQEYAVGFESKRYNIKERWESINHAVNLWYRSPLIGTGVGLRKQYDATNIVLLVLAETGVVGLFLFALIHANIARFVWQNHKLLDNSTISFSCIALGGALVAARLAHGLVDHYWSRGAILAAWAAVGMAVACYKWHLENDLSEEYE